MFSSGAWEEILRNRQAKRQNDSLLKFFPQFLRGEDLFGLSEPTIQRMLESVRMLITPQRRVYSHYQGVLRCRWLALLVKKEF